MQASGRRRRGYAIGVSALAHFLILALAFTQRPTLPIPPYAEAPSPDVINIELVPRRSPSATPAPLRVRRAAQALPGAPAPLPLPSAPSRIPPSPQATAPGPGPGQLAPAGPDLRAALRHGLAGCANLASLGIARARLDDCDQRLGRGAANAPFLPAPIPTRIRAYYDQVAAARAPDPQPIRDISKGTGGAGPAGMFWEDGIATNGHGPGVGCKIHFGAGKKIANAPPHSLHWGPCFIEPPKGSLDPEVDITPP